ncbi:hypothetical protein UVI_02007720 [Ustilaginoidea virens]|uniref:Secreted in xylem 1 protein n=1 Tax=Ustilaginoidea virens TaxID=1159556 RepID=A0A1B5KWJ7_USTVR|nr:hypothetical protein UVI_02007720 [Ustilaginoidea virens]
MRLLVLFAAALSSPSLALDTLERLDTDSWTPAARGAALSGGLGHPRVFANLTLDEFFDKLSLAREEASSQNHKRQPVTSEHDQMCQEAMQSSSWRASWGACTNSDHSRRVYCKTIIRGADGRFPRERSVQKVCPVNKKCYRVLTRNSMGNMVHLPLCLDQLIIDKMEKGTLEEHLWYLFYKEYFAWNTEAPTLGYTTSYHVQMGEGQGSGLFTDTNGHRSRATSWSCIDCPPGRTKIETQTKSFAYAYVSS